MIRTIERIRTNKIKCRKCGDIIESIDVHDFKWCSCKSVAVDGGQKYLRRLGHFEDDIGKIVQSFLTVKACNIGDVKKVIREYNSVNNYILNTKEVFLSCVYHILYFVNVNYDYISDIEQYSHTIELCMQE